MIAIWKEHGEWDKEAYTAEHFDTMDELRTAAKTFRGVLSVVSVYGDDISKEAALRYYLESIKTR